MRGAINPLPQYVFMVWCLVKQRDNFTFYLYSGMLRYQCFGRKLCLYVRGAGRGEQHVDVGILIALLHEVTTQKSTSPQPKKMLVI
jgi:hypothetical protein